MMGKTKNHEQLCCEVRLNEHVPADHLLRRIDAVLDLSFVRPLLAPSYSSRGRPSVDPELMLCMLLIGYLHGIRSRRRLCEDTRFNLAYRWFCRLGLHGAVPDYSTFSKNRHGRFRICGLFRALFEQVVERCIAAGLVAGQDMAVDASVVTADASPARRKPGDTAPADWGDRDAARRPVREYLDALGAAVPPAPDEPKPSKPKHLSETDPQAGWSNKHGPGEFAYATNYLIDTQTSVILDVEASPARFAAEVATTKVMLRRTRERFGVAPERLAADKAYGSAPLLAWLFNEGVEPHIPVLERKHQTGGKLTRDSFVYDLAQNVFVCPQNKVLRLNAREPSKRSDTYRASEGDCRDCPIKAQCTDSRSRAVTRLWDEDARDRVRALAGTPAFARSRRLRKRIERLFAHLKHAMALRRLRLRGLLGAQDEFLLAAAAQNLGTLVRHGAASA